MTGADADRQASYQRHNNFDALRLVAAVSVIFLARFFYRRRHPENTNG